VCCTLGQRAPRWYHSPRSRGVRLVERVPVDPDPRSGGRSRLAASPRPDAAARTSRSSGGWQAWRKLRCRARSPGRRSSRRSIGIRPHPYSVLQPGCLGSRAPVARRVERTGSLARRRVRRGVVRRSRTPTLLAAGGLAGRPGTARGCGGMARLPGRRLRLWAPFLCSPAPSAPARRHAGSPATLADSGSRGGGMPRDAHPRAPQRPDRHALRCSGAGRRPRHQPQRPLALLPSW